MSTFETLGLVCKQPVSFVYFNAFNGLSEVSQKLVSFVYKSFTIETPLKHCRRPFHCLIFDKLRSRGRVRGLQLPVLNLKRTG